MKIILFGASGNVGRLLTAELLRRGHTVVAAVHKNKPEPAANLEIISVDITDPAAVGRAIEGCDAIASTLGSWGTRDKNIVSTAVQQIAAISNQRFVMVTGNGAALPDERLPLSSRLSKLMMAVAMPKVLRDAEDALMILSNSHLDWTALRSPMMTGAASSAYVLDADHPSLSVSRRAVAAAMADLLEQHSHVHQAPVISKG